MISGNEADRKANDLLTHFNENMQKALFFQCKIASDASRRGPKRPKVCNCRQTHFWKKIKTKIKKVKFAPLSSHTRPKIGLLDKRVPGRAPRSSEKRVFQKWAFRLDETLRKYRFAIICIALKGKSWWKKKSKKVKSNKTYGFYWSRCKSEHFSWEGCKKKRGHQITTTNKLAWGDGVLQRQNER